MAYHAGLSRAFGVYGPWQKPEIRSNTNISRSRWRSAAVPAAPAAGLAIGLALIAISLFAGMLGYHTLVGLSWIDSYENAAMILSGMGPLASPESFAGKLFAGSYALYSGIAVLAIAAVITAPLVHRFLHRLHADSERSR
jgi:hypothetical protein